MDGLVVGVSDDHLREVRDQLVVLAELQSDADPGLERREAAPLEVIGPGSNGRWNRRQVAEWFAPPQLHGVAERLVGDGGLSLEELASSFDAFREAVGVELLRCDAEGIPGSVVDDARAIRKLPEQPAEAGHVDLHQMVRAGRGCVAPQLVDETVSRDGDVGGRQEHRQQRALRGSPELECAVSGAHPERPQDVELHRSPTRRARPIVEHRSSAS